MARKSMKSIMWQVENILKPLDSIGAECGVKALELCKDEKPKLKAAVRSDVHEQRQSPPYTSCFTVKPLSDEFGLCGAALWNKDYQLSHLIENGHVIKNQYGGPYKNKKGYSDLAGNISPEKEQNVHAGSTTGRGSSLTGAYGDWKISYNRLTKQFEIETERIVDKALKK